MFHNIIFGSFVLLSSFWFMVYEFQARVFRRQTTLHPLGQMPVSDGLTFFVRNYARHGKVRDRQRAKGDVTFVTPSVPNVTSNLRIIKQFKSAASHAGRLYATVLILSLT